MPIYEYECRECAERFEELAAVAGDPICPGCGAIGARRLYSAPSPPGRVPHGARVRDSEARRGEREAARRARGETPKPAGKPPRPGGDS